MPSFKFTEECRLPSRLGTTLGDVDKQVKLNPRKSRYLVTLILSIPSTEYTQVVGYRSYVIAPEGKKKRFWAAEGCTDTGNNY